jgi:pimeloyl-ACP methyl ester carboxylesterase
MMQMVQDNFGRIDYSEEGGGPTIVFVPGSWATGSVWRPVIEPLAGRFRTITTSLPGYGNTRDRRTSADRSIDRQAEIVEAVIRRAGGPVHLVGHSFGALACLDVAMCGLHPLMSLTLIEPVTFGLLRQRGEVTLHAQFMAMRDEYFDAFENGEREAARRIFDYLGGEGSFDNLAPRVRQYLVDTTASLVLDMRTEFDPNVSALANILLPSVVINGERTIQPLQRSAEILSQSLANASLHTISGAGHLLLTTHSAQLAERIGSLVRETEVFAWSSLALAAPIGPRSFGFPV